MTACGIACPRDSDMQEAAVGAPVEPAADHANLERGDLLFWKGHVAIVRGPDSLIHANAFHMAVAIEPMAGADRADSPSRQRPHQRAAARLLKGRVQRVRALCGGRGM